MSTAIISPVTRLNSSDFVWQWRCAARDASSGKTFVYYYDCLRDAITHGYHVDLVRAAGPRAPESRYALEGKE